MYDIVRSSDELNSKYIWFNLKRSPISALSKAALVICVFKPVASVSLGSVCELFLLLLSNPFPFVLPLPLP